MLKAADLRGMTIDELSEKEVQLRKKLMDFRFQAKMGKLEKQSSIRETKRDIARILTTVNELKRSQK